MSRTGSRSWSAPPPGPLWRDDHRASARAPALRPIRVRAVLGRRRTRSAAGPAHCDATAGQDPRGRRKDAARREQPKAFYPALSMCDLIFAGVFERHPRLRVAIVESELAWAPHLLSTMDYTYRERHGEAIYRFKSLPPRRRGDGMLPEGLLPPQDADGKSLLGLIPAPTRAYR